MISHLNGVAFSGWVRFKKWWKVDVRSLGYNGVPAGPALDGEYFGGRYFGNRYFGKRMFG